MTKGTKSNTEEGREEGGRQTKCNTRRKFLARGTKEAGETCFGAWQLDYLCGPLRKNTDYLVLISNCQGNIKEYCYF